MPCLRQSVLPHRRIQPCCPKQNGLHGPPLAPPEPGQATVFEAIDYSKVLAGSVLGVLTLLLYGFVLSDIGTRLLKLNKGPKKDASAEAMV